MHLECLENIENCRENEITEAITFRYCKYNMADAQIENCVHNLFLFYFDILYLLLHVFYIHLNCSWHDTAMKKKTYGKYR